MASLRRALSQNGSLFAVPSAPSHAAVNASAGLSPTALSSSGTAIPPTEGYYSKVGALALPSFLPLSWLRTTKTGASEKTKSKGSLVKKPIYLLAICFVLGLLLGLTPISWYGAQPGFELDNGFDTTPDEAGTRGDSERTTTTSVKSGSHPARLLGPRKVWTTPLKPLIIVTPTYNRPLQAYYLTRLAHTLRLVPPPLLWLVVEELSQSTETAQLLRQTGIMYRHLICNVTLSNIKDRGTSQRNTALAHIEHHQLDGIVYFADDDNIYSLELFEQLREIKRFGTWPVGMLAPGKSKTILEGPVCNGHEVVGWHTNEKSALLRRFHVDMSGFGFNSTILWDPRRWGKRSDEPIRQRDDIKEGMQETTFMEQLIEDESQMEGLPSGCSKVMVWHMHFETPGLPYPPGWTLSEHLIPVIPLQVSD